MAAEAASSTARTSEASAFARAAVNSCAVQQTSGGAEAAPIEATCAIMSIPHARRSALQTAPAATRATVERADDRSSTSRASCSPNFNAPERSAWPGRGRVSAFDRSPDGGANGSITSVHAAKSRFFTIIASGEPSVTPPRSPPKTST